MGWALGLAPLALSSPFANGNSRGRALGLSPLSPPLRSIPTDRRRPVRGRRCGPGFFGVGLAQVCQQAAGSRHLAANRTRYFRLSHHDYPYERACRRRDRPCHVVDRDRRSRSVGDGRVHSQFCSDSRSYLGRGHFPVRRLAHDRFDLASLAPGGARRRHSCDRRRDGDAIPSREAVYAQSGSRRPVSRVLVPAVGRPWRNSFGANSGDDQDRVGSRSAACGLRPYSRGLKA